jgi:hypothetical protein
MTSCVSSRPETRTSRSWISSAPRRTGSRGRVRTILSKLDANHRTHAAIIGWPGLGLLFMLDAHRSTSARTDSERALTAKRPPASTSFAPVDTSACAPSPERKGARRPFARRARDPKGHPDEPESVASIAINECMNVPERRLWPAA